MNKYLLRKMILTASACAVAVALTSCGNKKAANDYKILDEQMLHSENTTVAERRVYYDEYVDDLINNMDDKEKEEYYVTLNVKPVDLSDYNEYSVRFLRNDNEDVESIGAKGNCIKLPPGVYRIVVCREDLEDETFGEFAVLFPGKKVTLEINDEKCTARITRGDGKITAIYDEPISSDIEYFDENPLYYKAADAPKLDIRKLDSLKTSAEERDEYYKKNVDDIVKCMTEEEKSKYNITIHLEYKNEEDYERDIISILRNDDTYSGVIAGFDDAIELSPGIYRVISDMLWEETQNRFGEFAILTPGAEITMVIDYKEKTIRITNGDGKVTETNM